jgi:hypothetical protein
MKHSIKKRFFLLIFFSSSSLISKDDFQDFFDRITKEIQGIRDQLYAKNDLFFNFGNQIEASNGSANMLCEEKEDSFTISFNVDFENLSQENVTTKISGDAVCINVFSQAASHVVRLINKDYVIKFSSSVSTEEKKEEGVKISKTASFKEIINSGQWKKNIDKESIVVEVEGRKISIKGLFLSKVEKNIPVKFLDKKE